MSRPSSGHALPSSGPTASRASRQTFPLASSPEAFLPLPPFPAFEVSLSLFGRLVWERQPALFSGDDGAPRSSSSRAARGLRGGRLRLFSDGLSVGLRMGPQGRRSPLEALDWGRPSADDRYPSFSPGKLQTESSERHVVLPLLGFLPSAPSGNSGAHI